MNKTTVNKKQECKVYNFGKLLSIFIILLILHFPETAKSTCILIYYHGDSLTIGADCLVSKPTGQFDENGVRLVKKTTDCKIRKINNTFITGSGKQMDIIIESIQDYYLRRIENIDLLPYLIETLKKSIEENLNYLKKFDSTYYKQLYDGFMFARVAVIQFVNEIPDIKILAFSVETNENGQLTVNIFYQNQIPLNRGEKIMIPMGKFEAIRGLYVNPVFWKDKSAEEGIENLLQIQARAIPDEVGEPMSIFTLTRGSYEWYKKGSCDF